MQEYPIDVSYAWAQLGLVPGASLEDIQEIYVSASAYQFSTPARIKRVRHFVQFFVERSKFGPAEMAFAEIRKAYHKQAMHLHPDRNKGDTANEEQLKAINAAFAIVETVNRAAKDYFKKSEELRREIEREAVQAASRESRRQQPKQKPREETPPPPPPQDFQTQASVKFVAASIPRYIRNSRLFYLHRGAIIGSRLHKHGDSVGMLYDIVMLTEREFQRARLYLGMEGFGSPQLSMSKLTPAYISKDAKAFSVPLTDPHPERTAAAYFLKEFGLTDSKG